MQYISFFLGAQIYMPNMSEPLPAKVINGCFDLLSYYSLIDAEKKNDTVLSSDILTWSRLWALKTSGDCGCYCWQKICSTAASWTEKALGSSVLLCSTTGLPNRPPSLIESANLNLRQIIRSENLSSSCLLTTKYFLLSRGCWNLITHNFPVLVLQIHANSGAWREVHGLHSTSAEGRRRFELLPIEAWFIFLVGYARISATLSRILHMLHFNQDSDYFKWSATVWSACLFLENHRFDCHQSINTSCKAQRKASSSCFAY